MAEQLAAFPNGAFVKLDTRSPKDVPVNDDENPEVGTHCYCSVIVSDEKELAPVSAET